VTVAPGDPKAISTAISELLRDPERMRTLGSKGRFRVQTDSHRDKRMRQLACALEEHFAGSQCTIMVERLLLEPYGIVTMVIRRLLFSVDCSGNGDL
jgi:glycosyltransferase involved in cell wall biosynthesis